MKFVFLLLAIVLGWILFTPQKTEQLASNPQPTTHNLQPSSTPYPTKAPIRTIKNTVPFVPQAPFGNWEDLRQQEACEESSSLMAMRWVHGIESIDRNEGLEEILAISGYEEINYGGIYHDTSAADTIERIFKGYYNYHKVELVEDATLPEIITHVMEGHLIIAPTDGQMLFNPNYTPPGPERHMQVITGYDAATHEFITNDPGTRAGHNYRYDELVFWRAIRDYPTGYNLPITTSPKNIIIVKK